MSAGQSMAKAGRPKLAGVIREPSGKVSRTKAALPWQRVIEQVSLRIDKPDIGTPLGILVLQRKLDPKMADAGEMFAKERAAADRAQSLPSRTVQAQNVDRIAGRDNAEDEPEVVRAKNRAVTAYYKAVDAVGAHTKAMAAVEWVVIYQRRQEGHEQYLDLIDGLSKLAVHYRFRR